MFSKDVEKEVWQHALDEYPKEACGLIIDNGSAYVRFKNEHETPRLAFRMNQKLFLEYLQAGRISALMHSHTQTSPWKNNFPSKLDMMSQEQMAIPWGIVHISDTKDIDGPFYFGDQVPIPELVGRNFRPNVTDCWTLGRDYYWLKKKIRLPIYPREGFWTDTKKDILAHHMDEVFDRIDKTQLKTDDLMLGIYNAPRDNKVLNHVMIVQDNGLILHHLIGRLSKHDPIQNWINSSTIFLRYKGDKK